MHKQNKIIVSSFGKRNRPLYSCVLSYLALKLKSDWCSPCYDTDLSSFLMLMMSCHKVRICARKVVRFLSKQGQLQPHFHS